LAVGAALLLRPRPVSVQVAAVDRGPVSETVDEEGRLRTLLHETVSAPVSGRLETITFDVGDSVGAGDTVAVLQSAPLDPRALEQARARLAAAEAGRRAADARAAQARSRLADARRTRERLERLAAVGGISQQELDRSLTEERVAAAEVVAAVSNARSAAVEVDAARAALQEAGGEGGRIAVRTPLGGRVLRVFEEHERVVAAGTALLDIGDPAGLEAVVPVLSDDATRIAAGVRVSVSPGAGAVSLPGRVRLVEPAAYTKVSPLGVEEQRVDVIVELLQSTTGLGDGYRVDARTVLWETPESVRVASGAIFRDRRGWAVFVVERGRAELRPIEVGHRGGDDVEVLSGLEPGDIVVLHPPGDLEHGSRVRTAPAG
jgi:HlyD family secretion protein